MPKFRKKPVEIEAFQWTAQGGQSAFPEWFIEGMGTGAVSFDTGPQGQPRTIINTLEGQMIGLSGDWIIKGIKGELYPCKPDIFAATYESAS